MSATWMVSVCETDGSSVADAGHVIVGRWFGTVTRIVAVRCVTKPTLSVAANVIVVVPGVVGVQLKVVLGAVAVNGSECVSVAPAGRPAAVSVTMLPGSGSLAATGNETALFVNASRVRLAFTLFSFSTG